MISLDKQELQVLVSLRRNSDFIKFIEILNRSANALAIGNALTKDDVLTRWNQGKIQELLEILKAIKNADEDLSGYNAPARKHIE
jgi:hypothetical protein